MKTPDQIMRRFHWSKRFKASEKISLADLNKWLIYLYSGAILINNIAVTPLNNAEPWRLFSFLHHKISQCLKSIQTSYYVESTTTATKKPWSVDRR